MGPLGLGLGLYLGRQLGGGGAPAPAPPVNENVWVAEGDSITAGFNNYVTLIDADDATLTINNVATGGQSLSHFVTHLTNVTDGTQPATTLSYDAEFATILAGANDQCAYADVRDDWIAPVRAGGAKVILIAGLPQDPATVPSHAAYIATYNANAEAGYLAGEFDGFVDTRLSPMSVWNATNYGDYVHPTELGQQYLRHIVEPELNRLRGIANTPIFLGLQQPASAVSAGTVVTSAPFWLNGLGYGETRAISIVGGEYSFDGSTWTSAPDTSGNAKLWVRGTAGASGNLDVIITAGGVDATFTITTAAALTTTYRSSGFQNGGFGTSVTYPGVAFYEGENIIALAGVTGAAGAPTSVVLGGTSAVKIAEVLGGPGNANASTSFWRVTKASGGSGNLVVSSAGGIYSLGYSLWSTNAGASYVAKAEINYGYRADPTRTSTTIAKPSGGDVLIAVHSEAEANAITPESGTTEEAEFSEAGVWRFWFGRLASGNQPGVTGPAGGGSSMLAVSLQP